MKPMNRSCAGLLQVFSLIGVAVFAICAPAQAPRPTPASGPISILSPNGETLRKGEFRFSGGLETHQLQSTLMGRPVSYNVFLPLGYVGEGSRERYPVVFLLHGLMGNYTNWAEKTDFTWKLPNLKAVIVMPDGGDGWYTDSSSKASDKYESYLIQELIPEIDKKFRTIADREHRAIAGLSMGGYGAIKFGLKYPELFSVVGSFSGALGAASITEKEIPGAIGRSIVAIFGPAGSETRKGNDLFAMVRTATAERIKSLPFIYLDCGTEDFLFQNNRDFVSLLLEKRVSHEFRQLPGGHNWKYWGAQVEEFLELAGKRIGMRQGVSVQ